MTISRRGFLGSATAVTTGFLGLRTALTVAADKTDRHAKYGYGPLIPDPNGILDLPRGFSYKIISTRGDTMTDGFLVPGQPDGMATFACRGGLTILIRNHENEPHQHGPFGKGNRLLCKLDCRQVADAVGRGGTTTIVFDTKTQKVVRQFLSLAGTVRNCAGGPTPWRSWVSCEETVVRAGYDSKMKATLNVDHGYCYEVPATADIALADPVPLKAMGRFRHEAIAVEPKTKIVYETEDRDDGALYRFLPHKPGHLRAGGKLQVLKFVDRPKLDTRNWTSQLVAVGKPAAVEWLEIDNVESPNDDLRDRAFAGGAARFARGEGMWYGHKSIFFACTSGGKAKKGQIWRYIPSPCEGTPQEKTHPATLELFVEPNDGALVENADNLTVSPWGDLVVCEDRNGPVVRLLGVTPRGEIYTLANNQKKTEFAGATFSPDGTTLFVNLQGAGLTVAITGPWKT